MSLGLFFFDFERNRTLGKLERVGYRCLSSFLYFSIVGQGDQRHILNPNADTFIPSFQATGGIQTDGFDRPEFGYVFYLISIVHLESLWFMRTKWSIVWNIIMHVLWPFERKFCQKYS